MPPLRLPIGIQSFSELRNGGYAYVDKTRFIVRLVESGKYYSLSRPRRFGKSLFLDTLDCAFSGRSELFTGLYIKTSAAGWDFTCTYPVIRISLGQRINRSLSDLYDHLTRIISHEAERFAIPVSDATAPGFQLEDLIKGLNKKYNKQVVLLIDEYDKPILDNLSTPSLAGELRDELKSFYSIIKDLDPYLKFVLLTGVSRFSKTGIFSGLNNLNDITLDAEYSSICGYTGSDLEEVFTDHLSGFDRDTVQDWYNGYSWTGESVYNPFDILLLFSKGTYRSYWFETGTPTFLISLWQKNPRLPAEYEGLVVGDELLGSFEPERIRTESLLFQAGYLTVKSWSSDPVRGFRCVLGYPNTEVRTSLNFLFSELLCGYDTNPIRDLLYEAFEKEDPEEIRRVMHSFFASIPHDWYRKNPIAEYEGYYASVVYTYLASLGYEVIPEDTSNKGQINLTVKTKTAIWIFEFKVLGADTRGDKSPLKQIQTRGYLEKYAVDPRKKFGIGIVFNPKLRNIEQFDVETML